MKLELLQKEKLISFFVVFVFSEESKLLFCDGSGFLIFGLLIIW